MDPFAQKFYSIQNNFAENFGLISLRVNKDLTRRPHLAQLIGFRYSVGEDRFLGLASPVLSRVSAYAAGRRSVTCPPYP